MGLGKRERVCVCVCVCGGGGGGGGGVGANEVYVQREGREGGREGLFVTLWGVKGAYS